MGVPKVGTAYADVELDAMFEAYQKDRFIYFVVEHGINTWRSWDCSIKK